MSIYMTDNMLHEELIIAGFGGQGIILAGKLIAQCAMECGYEITFMPSYGAEVRGGTSKCMVVISDNPIACPIVNHPDSLIVMNKASFSKYVPQLKSGGLLIMNSSLVPDVPDRDDIEVITLPADDIANNLQSPRSANMAALGAYIARRRFTDFNPGRALEEVLSPRYHKTIPVNRRALEKGGEYAFNGR